MLDNLHPQAVQLLELIHPYFQVERIWYNIKLGAKGGFDIWEIIRPLNEVG